MFNRFKEENKSHLFDKLIAVAGDVGEENLGLSSADRLTLVEDIQIVFHSAATLDFEADLKSTTTINLLGTRRVVELCQEIRDLKVNCFLHFEYFITFPGILLNPVMLIKGCLDRDMSQMFLSPLGAGTRFKCIRQFRIARSRRACVFPAFRREGITETGGKFR